MLHYVNSTASKMDIIGLFCSCLSQWCGKLGHLFELNTMLGILITPCAHARSGVKQSVCLSVCQSSVQSKRLESRHIDPHKPSKGSQTIANSKKLLYVVPD